MIYIMRGLPGSGKSAFVKHHKFVCSADKFHMVGDEYQYDPRKQGEAHAYCLREYTRGIINGIDEIVVDNTNTTCVELAPYVRLAEAFNLNYQIIYLVCDVQKAFSRQIHKVPINTMLSMQANLLTERLPPTWNQIVKFVE